MAVDASTQKTDFWGCGIPKSAVATARWEPQCTCNLHDCNKEAYPRCPLLETDPPATPELTHAERINMAIVLKDQAVHEERLNSPDRSRIRRLLSAHKSSPFD